MDTQRIFVVDDKMEIVRMVGDALADEGFAVDSDTNPVSALKKIKQNPPHLVLLDIRMKEMSGLDVCRALKADRNTAHVLVVMMSVKAAESDVIVGLEMGADDYIRKPIQIGELIARVRAVLRRNKPAARKEEKIAIGSLLLDVPHYTASIDGKKLDLRPKEFEILAYLARNEGRVVTRQGISEGVWGRDHIPSSHTIEFHVYELRKKLGKYEFWITALKGIGYRFEVEE